MTELEALRPMVLNAGYCWEWRGPAEAPTHAQVYRELPDGRRLAVDVAEAWPPMTDAAGAARQKMRAILQEFREHEAPA